MLRNDSLLSRPRLSNSGNEDEREFLFYHCILQDSLGIMDNLNLNIANVTIIKTNNNKVEKIKNINTDDLPVKFFTEDSFYN